MDDLISRQAAIDALIKWYGCEPSDIGAFENIIEKMPSAQPEPLTDKEQRIFLAAMGREEKVCKQVDEECIEQLETEEREGNNVKNMTMEELKAEIFKRMAVNLKKEVAS